MNDAENQECRTFLSNLGKDIYEVYDKRILVLTQPIAVLKQSCPCWYLSFEKDPDYAIALFQQCIISCNPKAKLGPLRITKVEEYAIDCEDLKAANIGKFVQITGFAFKCGSVQYVPIVITHKCNKCGVEFQYEVMPAASIGHPTKCHTVGCPSTAFSIVRDSSFNIYRKKQSIKIRDANATGSSGLKKAIEVILFDELTQLSILGQQVFVSGIVKSSPCKGNVYLADERYLCIEANNVHVDYTTKELDSLISVNAFQEVMAREDKNFLDYLCSIFCPRIYGRKPAKKGLLLALLSGSDNRINFNATIRNNCHVLLIGDPGMGKSQLLLAASEVAPKGIYACGVTSSSVGLTASATNDDGELAIEAGAVVLADKGVCCLDELDKIQFDHRSLLEAMEQQSVHIAKAGTVASLPARTSILAAANPINGHFDTSKRLIENIKLPSPLLSRFDIIFVLRDEPNVQFDAQMSRQIFQPLINEGDRNKNFLRQFIALARSLKPKLTEEAAHKLFEHYMQVKSKPPVMLSIPITVRYLESLIRLSEAHAKVHLRTFVSERDVEEVINLMREAQEVWFNPVSHVNSKPKRGKSCVIRTFIQNLLNACSQANETLVSEDQLRKIFDQLSVQAAVINFTELIDTLNQQGILLLKGGNGSNRTFKVMKT